MSPARPPAARIERAITVAQVSMSLRVYPTTVGLPVVPDDAWMRDDLLARDREHPERIVVAKIRLDREREVREVRERFQVAGRDALGVERLAVVRERCRRRA